MYYINIIKYNIGCESNGKKAPILWKNMSTTFPGSPHTIGFKGFSREAISEAFPTRWVFLPFLMLWEIDEKTHASHI